MSCDSLAPREAGNAAAAPRGTLAACSGHHLSVAWRARRSVKSKFTCVLLPAAYALTNIDSPVFDALTTTQRYRFMWLAATPALFIALLTVMMHLTCDISVAFARVLLTTDSFAAQMHAMAIFAGDFSDFEKGGEPPYCLLRRRWMNAPCLSDNEPC